MTTAVVPADPVQPFSVALTEYVPEAKVVILPIIGFCKEEEKPLGPVQEYVELPMVLAVKLNVVPEQIGLLLPATGAAGIRFTVTAVVPADPVHPNTVTETEYVPASRAVTPLITGFCEEEEKPFGPVQE